MNQGKLFFNFLNKCNLLENNRFWKFIFEKLKKFIFSKMIWINADCMEKQQKIRKIFRIFYFSVKLKVCSEKSVFENSGKFGKICFIFFRLHYLTVEMQLYKSQRAADTQRGTEIKQIESKRSKSAKKRTKQTELFLDRWNCQVHKVQTYLYLRLTHTCTYLHCALHFENLLRFL